MDSNFKTKSFFEKPEGKTGSVFLILILGILGIGVYKILQNIDYLVTLMQNLYYLAGMAIGAVAILYVLFDPTFRNNMWTLYKLAMRKMTGMIVELDPIAIQKQHVQTLKDKRVEMDEHLSKLNGSRQSIAQTLNSNEKARVTALQLAQQAQKAFNNGNARMKNEETFQEAEAGRYADANKEIIPVQNTLTTLYTTLSKVYDDSEYLVRDLESQIKINEQKYKAIIEGTNTIKAAGKFFNSNDAEQEMFLQSMEYVENDMNERVGAIDRFLQNTTTIMDSIDLKNGMMQEKGAQMLADFQNQDYTKLLKPMNITDSVTIPDNSVNKILVPANNYKQVTGNSNTKYEDL